MPRRGSLRTHPEKGATEGGAVDAAARVLGQPRGWRVAQGEGICKRAAWSAESEAREPEPRRAPQGVWRRGGGGGKDRTSERALWARGGRRGGRRGRARLSSAPARPQTALRRPRLSFSARRGLITDSIWPKPVPPPLRPGPRCLPASRSREREHRQPSSQRRGSSSMKSAVCIRSRMPNGAAWSAFGRIVSGTSFFLPRMQM
ncbi:uncharacterized protein isoform X2 [Macaca fascicularis]|uniref:uncharacterized protein isoform X2 n=1 Tax=Macaca fascicularis TaxID=9541 RepID=UPI0032B03B50